MPLKIRVKPEGKIFAGGAVLKNVGTRPADLLILSDSPVLREDYMMNIDRRDDSDVSNVYFLLQIIYLFKGKDKPMDSIVVETVKSFAKLYPQYAEDIQTILTYMDAKETFKALKIAHNLLERENQAASPAAPVSAPAEAQGDLHEQL